MFGRLMRTGFNSRVAWTILGFASAGSLAQAQTPTEPSPAAVLGKRLFLENRLSNPGDNFLASCGSCHKANPSGGAVPSFADDQPRSLIPSHSRGEKSTTLRNTPSLVDVSQLKRFGHDGRYASLEEAIRAELGGRNLGWNESEAARAQSEIHTLLLNDGNEDAGADGQGSYVEQFKKSYDADLAKLKPEQTVDYVVKALGEYLATIKAARSSPWDAFASMNRIPVGPNLKRGEEPKVYAGRVFGRLGNQEGRLEIKLVDGLGPEAYEGFKIFYRGDGKPSSGNCVACHVPPLFTDGKFHNTGVAQSEYEKVHGTGSFARLNIPVTRPADTAKFRSLPDAKDPSRVDLGYWSYVDPAPAEKQGGETEEALLSRMAGAFKTPSLRNLSRSAPYLHNGSAATIEEALGQIVAMNKLAREGKARGIDPEYVAMNLSEKDIRPLAAYLRALDEVPREQFRQILLSAARHTNETPGLEGLQEESR